MTDSARQISLDEPSQKRVRRRLLHAAIWSIVAGVLAWQFATNGLRVSDARMFSSFQRDSEALVIGKMVSERTGVPIPFRDAGVARANLALAWVDGVPPSYEAGIGTVLQGYDLLDAGRPLPDLRLAQADFNGVGWADGIATSRAGIAVTARRVDIAQYMGRTVRVDGTRRFLQGVAMQREIAMLLLSGPPTMSPKEPALGDVIVLGAVPDADVLRFNPYTSQYGLQGVTFAWLGNDWRLNLQSMYLTAAVLLGIVLATLAMVYARLIGPTFCVVFVVTLLLSPWITNFGRNIYWVPFTWFLPACLLGLGILARSNVLRGAAAVGYFLAVLLKCLCGYEYLSTVILFASAPCVAALVPGARKLSPRTAACWFAAACALGAAAFVVALVLQSPMKAPTVWQGVASIIEQDAVRRTHGDPSAFAADGDAVSSLSQSTLAVLQRYLFNWRTDLIAGVPGAAFAYLVAAALVAAVVRTCLDRDDRWRHTAMLVAFVAPAISWYVLGKGHSARHYHMNYVLWYLGAVPVCVWICASAIVDGARRIAPARSKPSLQTREPPKTGRRKGSRGASGRKSRG